MVLRRSGESIEAGHEHNIKLLSLRVRHQPVELGPAFFCSTPAQVHIFHSNLELAVACKFAQGNELCVGILALVFR